MTELFSAMQKEKIEPKNIVFITPKPDSAPDLILVRGVKGAKPYLKSRPPFVIQDEFGNRTKETEILYETGNLNPIKKEG